MTTVCCTSIFKERKSLNVPRLDFMAITVPRNVMKGRTIFKERMSLNVPRLDFMAITVPRNEVEGRREYLERECQ